MGTTVVDCVVIGVVVVGACVVVVVITVVDEVCGRGVVTLGPFVISFRNVGKEILAW